MANKKYYHVSTRDLGDEFVLTPKIPHDAIDLREEDFTTARVCFAPTIKQAIDALAFSEDEYGRALRPRLFVYAALGQPKLFTPKSGEVPLSIYDLPHDERAKALEGWVPDAHETGEVWSLKPVKVKKIKTLGKNDEALDMMREKKMSNKEKKTINLNEWQLSLVGKMFATGVGMWLVGQLPHLKLRGTQEEVTALANALRSSKRFHDELQKPGATVQSVVAKLGLKSADARQFEKITGVPFPL